jgi:alpha-mannosidase/mannosylglycerate hydrolase
MSTRRAHYILSTHWDREWYQTFQDYRYRLVQLLDGVLDGLAAGELVGPFVTDGQAIVLEDYLEVRPERRAQVEQLARAGRLAIGPWYVMPDEFLVSGESLIRNLRLGRQVARSFGAEPSNAGFVCDIFGHCSQLPQILAGFGIPGALIWRGCNQTERRQLLWTGADGTVMPSYRFGRRGYCSYAFAVRHAFSPGHAFDSEEAEQDLKQYIEEELAANDTDPILLFDGGDHQEWDRDVYRLVKQRMALPYEGIEIVHSSLDAYLQEMLAQRDRIQGRAEGELREPGREPAPSDSQWLIPGVLSSRAWIKQANAACQTLLCQWAEPMAAVASHAVGQPYPQGFLDVAWRWLLQNHPHDSICGCSIDAVHEDMKFRFHQCHGIASRLTTEATRKLAADVAGEIGPREVRVVVFNPAAHARQETAELTLGIPSDWNAFNEFFGFESKPAFRIYDAEGNELPYQRIAQAVHRRKTRIHGVRFPEQYYTDDVTVSLPLSVPSLGYAALTVREGEPGLPTRHPETPGLATSERSMANEFLGVVIESNGTLTLTDRNTGQVYTRLLTFEDCADIGDGWFHGMAINDQTHVSTACRAEVALVHNGPMLTSFRVRTHMAVPERFCFGSMTRSEILAEVVIDSKVSLRPRCDRLEIETRVHNSARDHRLRALFPSGSQTDVCLSDTPFDVVERTIPLRANNHLYRELEVETRPQQSWCAVHDASRGLAIISVGQMEFAVRDLPERPLALTLFRSTQRTVGTDGEPEGQLLGELTFRYWLAPLAGAPDRVRLCQLGQQLAAGLRDAQLQARDQVMHRTRGALPARASMLEIDGSAVLTSLRQVGETLEVRLFNPTDEAAEVTLTLGELARGEQAFTRVQRVNLESDALGPAEPLKGEGVALRLGAKQIVTLSLS